MKQRVNEWDYDPTAYVPTAVKISEGQVNTVDKENIYYAAYPPVPLASVPLDGIANATPALTGLLAYVKARNGGHIVLPDCVLRLNAVITGGSRNITITGTAGKTILKPFDPQLDCLTVGDGTAELERITIRDIDFIGTYDETHQGSGLVVNGLYGGQFENLKFEYFGKHNIKLTSSVGFPTTKIGFVSVQSNEACYSNLYMEQGGMWTSAINLIDFSTFVSAKTNYTVYNDNCTVNCTNTYFDVLTNQGIFITGDNAKFLCNSVEIDNGSAGTETSVVIETDRSSTSFYFPFYGSVNFSTDCAIKYNGDAVTIPIRSSGFLRSGQKMYGPNVYGTLKWIGAVNKDVADADLARTYYDSANNMLRTEVPLGKYRVSPGDGVFEIEKNGTGYPDLQFKDDTLIGQFYMYQGNFYFVPPTGGNVGFWAGDFAGPHFKFGSTHLYVNASGRLKAGAGATDADNFILAHRRNAAPATATSTGSVGDYFADATGAYFCIATNTWVRAAVATF